MRSLSAPGSGIVWIRTTIKARWLRQQGYEVEATAFGTIASIRTGHWYGRQGNGDAAHELDTLLAQLEAWSVV